MKTIRIVVGLVMASLFVAALPATAHAQNKSRSEGFFLGGGYEGNVLGYEGGEGTDSGPGFGVTVGYGLTRNFAIYGQWSGASIDLEDGESTVRQFEIGTRVHFRAPAKIVVPFVQAGLSARALRDEVFYQGAGPFVLEQSGFGLAVGGGINAHFHPAIAFTAGVAWSIGNLSDFKFQGTAVDEDAYGMTIARVHVGITWFVQSK